MIYDYLTEDTVITPSKRKSDKGDFYSPQFTLCEHMLPAVLQTNAQIHDEYKRRMSERATLSICIVGPLDFGRVQFKKGFTSENLRCVKKFEIFLSWIRVMEEVNGEEAKEFYVAAIFAQQSQENMSWTPTKSESLRLDQETVSFC